MKAMIVLFISLAVLFCPTLSLAQEIAPSEKARKQVDNVFRFMHVTIDQPKPIQQPKSKPTPPAPVKKETAAPVVTQAASAPVAASMPTPKEDPVPVATATASVAPAVVEEELQELEAFVKIIPEFPPKLMEKLKGTATFDVRFYIEPSGAVNGVTIEDDKFPLLSPYVIKSVSQWKFNPIKRRQLAAVQIIVDASKEY